LKYNEYGIDDDKYIKIDDKLYNLIEEHFKIDIASNHPEATYHSYRNDVVQLFAELFGLSQEGLKLRKRMEKLYK
jgi:hypothetical protein